MRGDEEQTTDIPLKINTGDYFLLDDELIVFIPARQEYFGLAGAARLVFDAVAEEESGATECDVRRRLGDSRSLTAADDATIRNAIRALIELGVLHEQ